jgi:hypothetical protein
MWELPSWQSYYGLTPSDWPALRETVRDALADGPRTRKELGEAVTAEPRFRHLGSAFADGAGTLLKPLAWQGDMSFGPLRDGRATFQRLDDNPRWAGIPDLDEAGFRAVERYVAVYGPTTPDRLQYWLGEGLGVGRKRLRAWFTDLEDRLAAVDVDGEPAYVLREHVDALVATEPTTVVRLLPGYDQWVLGPGTADAHVVPPARRALVSRGAGLVTVGGVVSATWSLRDDGSRSPGSASPDRPRRRSWRRRSRGWPASSSSHCGRSFSRTTSEHHGGGPRARGRRSAMMKVCSTSA